jgi:hypothetical protein
MARLGELLVAAKLLTPEQVEQALRAQVVWGGRIGSILIELGFLDLDGLSRALGHQHGLPAALARHFDKADPELQALLDSDQADRWEVVPLLRIGPTNIAIAVIDPIGQPRRAEIARALGIAPGELVVSVAAEQRMRYQLERVYGIARSARFLRTKGPTITPFPLDEVPITIDIDSDPEIAIAAVPEQLEYVQSGSITVHPNLVATEPTAPVESLAELIDEAARSAVPRPIDDDRTGRERRTYIRTLGELDAGEKALGRIAIRKVPNMRVAVVPQSARAEVTTLPEAARAIRRGSNREEVAQLAMSAIDRFAPTCEAALLMVLRGELVVGWKSFGRGGQLAAELAVPLHQSGLAPLAIARDTPARGRGADLSSIDRLLLSSLTKHDLDLVIVPVSIAGRVMCLIAAAMQPDAAVAVLEAIASAAGTAFARLMRDASR